MTWPQPCSPPRLWDCEGHLFFFCCPLYLPLESSNHTFLSVTLSIRMRPLYFLVIGMQLKINVGLTELEGSSCQMKDNGFSLNHDWDHCLPTTSSCTVGWTSQSQIPWPHGHASFVSLGHWSRTRSGHMSWALVSADKARSQDQQLIQGSPAAFFTSPSANSGWTRTARQKAGVVLNTGESSPNRSHL